MPFVRGTRYTTLARGAGGNTAPTITVPGAQSATSNVALAITGISISDPESQSQTVSISVSHGTFSLASTTGLSFSVGDGTADASMTFSGTLANCNTAIATLTYTSTTDYTGSDTLTINSTDSGGGAATQKTVAITVTFTPASTSSLIAWYEPNTSLFTDVGKSTVAQVGDPVYWWLSKNGSGIDLTQATLANRPPLQSTSGLRGVGGDSSGVKTMGYSGTTGLSNATGYTFGIRGRNTNAANEAMLRLRDSTHGNIARFLFIYSTSKFRYETANGAVFVESGAIASSAAFTWVVRISAAGAYKVYWPDGNTTTGTELQSGFTCNLIDIVNTAGRGEIRNAFICNADIGETQAGLLFTYLNAF